MRRDWISLARSIQSGSIELGPELTGLPDRTRCPAAHCAGLDGIRSTTRCRRRGDAATQRSGGLQHGAAMAELLTPGAVQGWQFRVVRNSLRPAISSIPSRRATSWSRHSWAAGRSRRRGAYHAKQLLDEHCTRGPKESKHGRGKPPSDDRPEYGNEYVLDEPDVAGDANVTPREGACRAIESRRRV